MRLTHLKLAGFKSFVDPTTIQLHGQRVGVVGPNGCGKSNVMESVRWVLGESSAKEMRADAMDAVIFNGSAQRKAISRASVELIFDNRLGTAGGEWHQYAEISVKRVIEREKGSTYYINNTPVRRRDVADLFLGTGLGGRAYAIIGQNTISRIVEAKPEELRIFLEEAAGISKYKERRRETELRLRDTRENLARVEDLSRELNKQIQKLDAQAQITQRYHALKQSLALVEGQWWWLRKRDALSAYTNAQHSVARAVNALEAQTAVLREQESRLETLRQSQQASANTLHDSQAHYYELNAQASNLSLQVQQSEEARARLLQQQAQIQQQLQKNADGQQNLTGQLQEKTAALTLATTALQSEASELATLQAHMPQQMQAWQASQAQALAAAQAVQQHRQQIQLSQHQQQFLSRQHQEAQQRLHHIHQQLTAWQLPDIGALTEKTDALQTAQQALTMAETTLQQAKHREQMVQASLVTARAHSQAVQRRLHQAEAEIASLQKLQKNLSNDQTLLAWLKQAQLHHADSLWQHIAIETAWQPALEALLGETLNARLVSESLADVRPRPPTALALVQLAQAEVDLPTTWQGLPSVYHRLTIQHPALKPALAHLLAGVFLLDDEAQLARLQPLLPLGYRLLSPSGDVYSRHALVFHGKASALGGVLERQQQLAQLQAALPEIEQAVQAAQQQLNALETELQAARTQQQQQHLMIKQHSHTCHQLQLTIASMQQAHDNAIKRQQSLQQDQAEVQEKVTHYAQELAEVTQRINTLATETAALEAAAQAASKQQAEVEARYFSARDTLQTAEKNHQAQQFSLTLLQHAVRDLQQKIDASVDEQQQLSQRLQALAQSLAVSAMETLKTQLVAAIAAQKMAEQALAAAREQADEQAQLLQQQDRARLLAEQQLHPLRDQLEQTRLQAQACLLQVEQCQQGLSETGLTEAELCADLAVDSRVDDFASRMHELQQKIAQLGPVNLAAIAELAQETERKSYLDRQLHDLLTASDTLMTAIQKIDRDTRGKLKATFEAANLHFAELFQTLFNGGHARLELLGEEILETGVQVFAQPPGKKNTTIQLLSGGEKALTAMALVFALFRLNPAPFCLMDEVDAPLDDSNTERFTQLVKVMSEKTQFLFVSHNKITMEMSQQLIGVTMQESGVSRIVEVDIEEAIRMHAA